MSLPISFVRAILLPYPKNAKENEYNSAIQRAGAFPLFDTNILLYIEEYYSSFPFADKNIKVKYDIVYENKAPFRPDSIISINDNIFVVSHSNAGIVLLLENNLRGSLVSKRIGENIVSKPYGLGFDKKRNLLFVSDIDKRQIHIFSLKDYSYTRSIGCSNYENKQYGIAVVNDNLIICDRNNNRLQLFSLETFIFMRSIKTPKYKDFSPFTMCYNHILDRLYVVNHCNDCIYVFSGDGTYLYDFYVNDDRHHLRDIQVSNDGQFLIILDFEYRRVLIHRCDDNSYVTSYEVLEDETVSFPCGMCLHNDSLLICDTYQNRIVRISKK